MQSGASGTRSPNDRTSSSFVDRSRMTTRRRCGTLADNCTYGFPALRQQDRRPNASTASAGSGADRLGQPGAARGVHVERAIGERRGGASAANLSCRQRAIDPRPACQLGATCPRPHFVELRQHPIEGVAKLCGDDDVGRPDDAHPWRRASPTKFVLISPTTPGAGDAGSDRRVFGAVRHHQANDFARRK